MLNEKSFGDAGNRGVDNALLCERRKCRKSSGETGARLIKPSLNHQRDDKLFISCGRVPIAADGFGYQAGRVPLAAIRPESLPMWRLPARITTHSRGA